MNEERQPSAINWMRSRTGLVLIAFLIIAAFFLLTEHRAHVFGVLPFLLLLLCPLLHFFHRDGHGGSGHVHHAGQTQKEKEEGKP